MKPIFGLALWLLSPLLWAATISLDCRVQYKKDGGLWHRAVSLVYDKSKLREVRIDDQPVYTFNLTNKAILTSVDSERIQIEIRPTKTTWRSNFRDRDFGVGACVKIK
jgi:hypothetical protein